MKRKRIEDGDQEDAINSILWTFECVASSLVPGLARAWRQVRGMRRGRFEPTDEVRRAQEHHLTRCLVASEVVLNNFAIAIPQ